ncbi:MAG: alpha/beta hydrolase [Candidatus Woesearchaeota archaeon]
MKNVILLHGRGASAESMMSFADVLPKANYIALQAPNNTREWYPHSFLNPLEDNEPHITNAVSMIKDAIGHYDKSTVIILGFSQGACLASEYAIRNPGSYGGIIMLSGGIIGNEINDAVDMNNTRVFVGCSDNDPYIPLWRVNETIAFFEKSNATVSSHIYVGSSHTVTDEEISCIRDIILGTL